MKADYNGNGAFSLDLAEFYLLLLWDFLSVPMFQRPTPKRIERQIGRRALPCLSQTARSALLMANHRLPGRSCFACPAKVPKLHAVLVPLGGQRSASVLCPLHCLQPPLRS